MSKMYINWNEHRVYNEENILEWRESTLKDLYDSEFDWYLESNYSHRLLFDMTEEDKREVYKEFVESVTPTIDEAFDNEFEEIDMYESREG